MSFYSSASSQHDSQFWSPEGDIAPLSMSEPQDHGSADGFGRVAIPAVAAALSLIRRTEKPQASSELT